MGISGAFALGWEERRFLHSAHTCQLRAHLLLSKSPCLHHQLMWPPGKCWVKRSIKGGGIPVPFTLFSRRLCGLNTWSLNNLLSPLPAGWDYKKIGAAQGVLVTRNVTLGRLQLCGMHDSVLILYIRGLCLKIPDILNWKIFFLIKKKFQKFN